MDYLIHTKNFQEVAAKIFEVDKWYIPHHLRIESSSKSNVHFMNYPTQVEKRSTKFGFEFRSLPEITTLDEFEKMQTFIEFEYWLIQASIAYATKKNQSSELSRQQKELAELLEVFFTALDNVITTQKIKLSSRESRVTTGLGLMEVQQNNTYLKDLHTIRAKAKANPRFEAQLLDMITTFVQNAKKACV